MEQVYSLRQKRQYRKANSNIPPLRRKQDPVLPRILERRRLPLHAIPDQLAQHNREIDARRDGAADRQRRHLRGVAGRDGREHAQRQAGQDLAAEEVRRGRGEELQEDAADVERVGGEDADFAAELVDEDAG